MDPTAESLPRRSTRSRMAKITSKLVDPVDTVNDDGSSPLNAGAESENEVVEEAHRNNKKKRKAPQPKQSSKKTRMRGTKGALTQIWEMPFDVTYEIFTNLLPVDLLNLGRTSKDLKILVLSKEFKPIWTQTLSLTGIPPCPDDLSQPQYAELAFGNSCFLCGASKDNNLIMWEVRARFCGRCFFAPRQFNRFGSLQQLPLLPAAIVSSGRIPGFKHMRVQFYSMPHANAMFSEYRALNTAGEKFEWEEATLERLEKVGVHADKCRQWHIDWQEQMEAQKEQELQERKARVVELIKELGWEEERNRIPSSRDYPENQEEILKICRKKLTDRVIENLRVTLNAIMKSIQDGRIDHENRGLVQERLKTMSVAYAEALASSYSPLKRRPRARDILVVPRIQHIVSDVDKIPDLTVADFNLDKQTLRSVIEEAYDIIHSKILKLVSDGLANGKKAHDPKTVLNLATTLFTNPDLVINKLLTASQRITAKQYSFLTLPQILVCDASRSSPIKVSRSGVLGEHVNTVFGDSSAWNPTNALSLNRSAHDAACKIVGICKLDPTKATLDEIEELYPILECVGCNVVSEGRLLLSWDSAVSHIIACHVGQADPQNILLIEGEDAEQARKWIKEKKRRLLYSDEDAQTVCLHCNATASLNDTLRHLDKIHGVMLAGDEDLQFAYCVDKSFSHGVGRPGGEYRMWPPRPPA